MKLDLIPEAGTSGSRTLGTFRAYCCLPLEGTDSRRSTRHSGKATSISLLSQNRAAKSKPRGQPPSSGMVKDHQLVNMADFDQRMSSVLAAIDTAMGKSKPGGGEKQGETEG